MNNQFATQFLLQEDEFNSLEDVLFDLNADEDLVKAFMKAIRLGLLTPSQAIDIVKSTLGLKEDGGAAAAPAGGGGSTTGGGVTNGATFTPGAGEQYAAGTRKKKVKEDAPRLAGSPAKTNKQGAKNLSAYSSVGFSKAPSAEEAGKKIKGVQVKMLWKEGEAPTWEIAQPLVKAIADKYIPRNLHAEFFDHIKDNLEQNLIKEPQDVFNSASNFLELYKEGINESKAYSQFKKEAATRSKPDQLHQAAKMVQNKLDEIEKLLEFTSQMRNELSEGNENLEYKHNTKKVFEKIHTKVVEVYTKVKGLK